MFKYIVFFFLIAIAVYADIENYYVGLRAYEDKFYDVASDNLQEFLKADNSSKEAIFAKYILYKISIATKDYSKAKYYFDMIKNVNDDRFDKKMMLWDEVLLTAQENCEEAYKLIDKTKDPSLVGALVDTKCTFNKITDNASLKQLSNKAKFYYIFQAGDKDKIKEAFNLIDLKNLSNSELKDLSIRLYKLEMMDEFWKVYERYRDKDTVNLAIERVWKTKKYEDVLKSYKYNRHIALLPETYCMVVDAHFKLNREFDCTLIDRCFTSKDANYYKSMIRCLADHKETAKIKRLVSSIPDNETDLFCDLGSYLISAKLLNKNKYNMVKSCSNIDKISEDLITNGFYDEVIMLRTGVNDDSSYYYLAIAYGMKNDRKNLRYCYSMIKNKDLKKQLIQRFKKI